MKLTKEKIQDIVYAIARKAQVDYVAVNHPDGIRHGQSASHLASYLQVDIEELEKLINKEKIEAGRSATNLFMQLIAEYYFERNEGIPEHIIQAERSMKGYFYRTEKELKNE